MTMLFMSVENLTVFVDVARLGSFAAVGKARSCVAYAISDAISELETDIGAQLVERTTRPMSLTESGQRFLFYVEELLIDVGWQPGTAHSVHVGPVEQFQRPDPFSAKRTIPIITKSAKAGRPETSTKSTGLPDGEFFVLCDHRVIFSDSIPGGEFVPDLQENEAIKLRRVVYRKSLEPDWETSQFSYADAFHRRYPLPLPMAPDLVHTRSIFNRPRKRRKSLELIFLQDHASDCEWYRLVSPDFKVAIESVEPGVHEFYAHDVVFSDAVWPRYIFRDRQSVSCFSSETSEPMKLHLPGAKIHASREALAGRHWCRQVGWRSEFVSRDLALRLLPLMEPKMTFVPIVLVD